MNETKMMELMAQIGASAFIGVNDALITIDQGGHAYSFVVSGKNTLMIVPNE